MSSATTRHLVIFGCGYVGTALARQALARGDTRVTALTRNAAAAGALREAGGEVIVADLVSKEWHDRVPAAPEQVVNCVSSGGGGLPGYRRSYVEGMASIVAWARRCGAACTFVYTSSTSVYPQGGGAMVDESAPTAGATERGRVLLEAETLLSQSAGVCGRWFVLRLAGIYGPGRLQLLKQVRSGEMSGLGPHHLNLVHRDDIVAAIRACLDAPPAVRNETFNVADDGAATRADVAGALAARLGVPLPRFTGLPPGSGRTPTPDRIIASTKLRQRLGWRPAYPTFREGYADLLSD